MANQRELVVKLALDMKEFQSGMQELNISISKNMEKIRRSSRSASDDMNSSFTKAVDGVKKTLKGLVTAFSLREAFNFGKDVMEASADLQALNAQFSQVFGDMEDTANKHISRMSKEFNMLPNRIRGNYSAFTSQFRGLGFEIEDSMDMATRALTLSADASAFFDQSIEEATEHVRSFIKGNYIGGESVQLFGSETMIATWASKNMSKELNALGGKWTELDEKSKQYFRMKYAEQMYKLSGVTGQARREGDMYTNVVGNLSRAWKDFKANLGMSSLNSVAGMLQKLANLLIKMKDKTDKLIKSTIGLAIAFATIKVLMTINSLANKYSGCLTLVALKTKIVTMATAAYNAVMAVNPITWVVVALIALATAFVVAYKKCDKFRVLVNKAWSQIKDYATVVKDYLVKVWDNIATACKPLVSILKDSVLDAFARVAQAGGNIKSSFSGVLGAIQSLWGTVKDLTISVGTILSPYWNALVEVLKFVCKVITGQLVIAFGNTISFLEGLAKSFDNILDMLKHDLGIIKGLFDMLIGLITFDGSKFKEGFLLVAESMLNVFKDAFLIIKDLFVGFGQGFKDFFVGLFNDFKLGELFLEKLSQTKEVISNASNAFVEGLSVWWTDIPDWFKEKKDTLVDGVKTWWGELVNWYEEKKSSVNGWFTGIFDEIGKCFDDPQFLVDKLNGWTEALNTWSEDQIKTISGTIDDWKEGVSNWFTENKNAFVEGLSVWWTDVPDWFVEQKDEIVEKVGEWADSIGEWWDNASNEFMDGLSKWWTDLPEWFEEKKEEFPEKLEGWKTAISDWFTEKKETISKGFNSWIESAKKWFEGDGAVGAKDTGKTITKKTSEGMTEKLKEKGMMQKIGDAILKFLGAVIIAIGVAILSVGYSIVIHVWNGMKKGFAWLKEKVSEAKETITGWFEDLPSKIGKAFSSGWKFLANGFISMFNSGMKYAVKGINKLMDGLQWCLDALSIDIKLDKLDKNWGQIEKLAKGTEGWHGGTALVGEAGRELVHDKGKTFMVNEASLLNLSKGAKVLSNPKTERLLKSNGIPAFASGKDEGWWDKFKGSVKDIWDYVKNPSKVIDELLKDFTSSDNFIAGTATKYIKSLKDKLVEWLKSQFTLAEEQAGYGAMEDLSKYISSGFGNRVLNGKSEYHKGIDLAGGPFAKGMPVYSQSSGNVLVSRFSDTAGYWNVIETGRALYKYMHMQKGSLKKKAGDRVKEGEMLGKVGNTGNSYGAHLHFQVEMNGKAVDPTQFFTGAGYGSGGSGGKYFGLSGQYLTWAKQALKFWKIPESQWSNWLTAFGITGKYESGFNQNARNKSSSASGWLQFLKKTWNSYAVRGHMDRGNGLDQAITFVKYIQDRYGSPLNARNVKSVLAGKGYTWYANGGIVNSATNAIIGEKGTEAVVPLSNARALKPFGQSVINALKEETSGNGASYEFTIPLYVDGREIAKATATFTKEELDKIDKRGNRLQGKK